MKPFSDGSMASEINLIVPARPLSTTGLLLDAFLLKLAQHQFLDIQ
ncbi:hypothetical protein KC19_5G020600 [Ceratodon purpureus]|uniref:Uncharacterized protein n=1 Tax=Ceratodon purpureus TaxID=3225 RepID=A0A8T0HYA8_CERPU|nr:hypothetical protein KC19_5G020600 [Ceratodon purpureus]